MSDKLTEDKLSVPTSYWPIISNIPTNSITTATPIMVLILKENYSFNLLSRLFYILYLGFLAMFIVEHNQTDRK